MLANDTSSPTIPTTEQTLLPEGESSLPTPKISTDTDELNQFDVTETKEAALDALNSLSSTKKIIR